MREKDVTSAQVSRATGISKQTLSNWLNGIPAKNVVQLKKVADYFGVSVDYLCFGEEEKKKEIFKEYENEIKAGIFEVVLRKVK